MGNYQYKYIVEDFCETLDDAETFSSSWDISVDPGHVAEDAAQNLFEYHSGWEATWPLIFEIFSVTGYRLGRFRVELEHQPTFAATEDKVDAFTAHVRRAGASIDAPEYDCLSTLGNLAKDARARHEDQPCDIQKGRPGKDDEGLEEESLEDTTC